MPEHQTHGEQRCWGYDPKCPECGGTGSIDSGGTHPWGEAALIRCPCFIQPEAEHPCTLHNCRQIGVCYAEAMGHPHLCDRGRAR